MPFDTSLPFPGQRPITGADFPPGVTGDPQAAVTINHNAVCDAQASSFFGQMAKGGAVIMPFEATFLSKGFGMVSDRLARIG